MIDFKYMEDGLIPAVIQDSKTGEVLMVAYMNKESFLTTLKTGKTHFYSRSRKKFWMKGEESGHTQTVEEILTDCDKDTILIKVKQEGGACHLGYKSCFVHKIDEKGEPAGITQPKVFDPEAKYKK
jgi:phosphoribosyl-AMP cyclohydrolase